jgi:hypothetical protein
MAQRRAIKGKSILARGALLFGFFVLSGTYCLTLFRR